MAISDFGKAFAAARKKHLAGKGKAEFTYKGKLYNVQTEQDRKTTVGKVPSPVKRKKGEPKSTSAAYTAKKKTSQKKTSQKKSSKTIVKPKSASQTFREQMKKASTVKADRTKSYDFSKTKVKTSEQLAKERKQRRLKNVAESISPAVIAAGGAGAVALKQGVKAVGGMKGVQKVVKKTAEAVKKERDARKGGYGKFERSPAGELKKQIGKQKSNVKGQKTRADNARIKAEQAAKKQKQKTDRKLEKNIKNPPNQGPRTTKFSRRARGGVAFKGIF
tara:strand:+ start:753 stop:1580 length:828 start_codon:yes stop_codon:yes gene_type:complete